MEQQTGNMNGTQHGSAQLHERIQQLIRESRDPDFTRYLNQLGAALWYGKIDDASAEQNLNHSLELYQNKMGLVKRDKTDRKNGLEFIWGAVIPGVIGVLFLLAAFHLFVSHYIYGIVVGCSMYAVFALVILAAKFFISRKNKGIATSLGTTAWLGMFAATCVNCWALESFSDRIGCAVTLALFVISFLVALKEKSELLCLVGECGVAGYALMALFHNRSDLTLFYATAILVLLVQAVHFFRPVYEEKDWMQGVRLLLVGIVTGCMVMDAVRVGVDGRLISLLLFLSVMLLNQIFRKQKADAGSITTFCISYFIITIAWAGIGLRRSGAFSYLGILLLALVTLFYTVKSQSRRADRWIPYWFFSAALILTLLIHNNYENRLVCVFGLAVIFAMAKLLGRFRDLRISNLVLSVLPLFLMLWYPMKADRLEGLLVVGGMAALYLLSLIPLHDWAVWHEAIISLACMIFVYRAFPHNMLLLIIPDVLVVFFFLFHFYNKRRGEDGRMYSFLNLVTLAVCYLGLIPEDRLWIHLILMVGGALVIIVCLDERYGLKVNNKGLFLGVYFTYMFFMLPMIESVVGSILWILTAAFCVTVGFVSEKKETRIYGLVLAYIATLKIAFWDYRGLGTTERMLTFLVAGCLIILISGIYFGLEQKLARREGKKNDEA